MTTIALLITIASPAAMAQDEPDYTEVTLTLFVTDVAFDEDSGKMVYTLQNGDRIAFHFSNVLQNSIRVAGEDGQPPSVVMEAIRKKCVLDWAGDFRMQAACQEQQIEGWRSLR